MADTILKHLNGYSEVESMLDEGFAGGVIGEGVGIADFQFAREFLNIYTDGVVDGLVCLEFGEMEMTIGATEAVDDFLCFGMDGELDADSRCVSCLGADVVEFSVCLGEINLGEVDEVDAAEVVREHEGITGDDVVFVGCLEGGYLAHVGNGDVGVTERP